MGTRRRIGNRMDLDDIPQREDSLGILSFRSSDLSLQGAIQNASQMLDNERNLAKLSLGKLNGKMTKLPERFLTRNSESCITDSLDKYLHSESTISESDLLLVGNSSTPRESLLSNMEYRARDRPSLGFMLGSLARSVGSGSFNLEKLKDTVTQTIADSEASFHSGASALAKLESDELSWQREKDIPAHMSDFSVDSTANSKFSVGSFFQKKSDDISNLMSPSPEKLEKPVPLIDTTNRSEIVIDQTVNNSVNVSDIQHLLSDTMQTPGKVLDYLINHKKRSSMMESVHKPISIQEASKENIDISDCSSISIQSCSSGKSSPISVKEVDIKERSLRVSENSSQNDTVSLKGRKSNLSTRSSSSLSSLPNGKLPIETTKKELIWGCVRLGKSAASDIIIRNRTASRLGIKCSLSNPSFRINDGSELNFTNSMKVILHPYESRKLTIVFAPNTIGAAADNLTFSPLDPNHKHTTKQFIKLYGYGGFGNIVISNMVKDTTGKYLLSLGNINEDKLMKKSFKLHNNGTLPVFSYIKFNSNGLSSCSVVNVSPQILVLLPEETSEVTVTYNPQKGDINYIKSKSNGGVFEIGKIILTDGTEVDRGRLRKVCQKAQDKGLEVREAILNLVGKFPGEVLPSDLKLLRESTGSMEEILRLFSTKELVVAVEQDMDYSLPPQLQDDTAMFQSLCENSCLNKFEHTLQNELCQVEPSRIILTSEKMSDMILLSNFGKKTLYFEASSRPDGLVLKPRNGTVEVGETCIISLTCIKNLKEKTVFVCRILVDNECFEVDVKVLPDVGRHT